MCAHGAVVVPMRGRKVSGARQNLQCFGKNSKQRTIARNATTLHSASVGLQRSTNIHKYTHTFLHTNITWGNFTTTDAICAKYLYGKSLNFICALINVQQLYYKVQKLMF